jgi:hypothetical protein
VGDRELLGESKRKAIKGLAERGHIFFALEALELTREALSLSAQVAFVRTTHAQSDDKWT